jgi:DNA-binding CsgD family transcriptional regulator
MNKPIAFIFAFLLIFGCNRSEKYADILNRAYELTDSNPDSVAKLLDLIDAPEKLPPSAKADYGYFKSLAHMKTYKAMAEDSLILFTLDYYKKNNTTGRLSRTYQLAVSYYNWKGDKTAALKTAQERLKYNIEENDSAGLIDSYEMLWEFSWNDNDYKNAIKYLNAASLYDNKGSYNRDYLLGLAYCFNEQADSAVFFFQKSIDSALAHKDTDAASHYIRNYADFLYNIHNYVGSISAMKRMNEINPVLNAKSDLTIADAYLALRQLDSAQVYLDKANNMKTPEGDIYRITTANHIMALQVVLDYAQGKPIDWSKQGQFNDSISVDRMNKGLLNEEGADTRKQLEHKNIKLTISQQRTLLALISVALLAALLVFVFLYYSNKRKEKIEALQSLLKEAMRSNDATKDDAFFKKMLLQQLGLVRQVATVPTAQNQALLKQISGIANKDIPVDDLLHWNDLYHTIDSIYDNFYTKLLKNYGSVLNDREIQLCCLLCAEFSTKEISVVTQQSVRTIYQRKTTIRQKLGMDEKDDIVEFLNKQK